MTGGLTEICVIFVRCCALTYTGVTETGHGGTLNDRVNVHTVRHGETVTGVTVVSVAVNGAG